MDRALLVKNAVSTVKTIKILRVPVVRSTVNVASDRDGQTSPTSPAVYQLDHLPSQQEVLAIAGKWRPRRSLATSYLFSAASEPAETLPVARRRSA
jgi:hypothetical protein